jgi:hypothetical protein
MISPTVLELERDSISRKITGETAAEVYKSEKEKSEYIREN